MKKTMKFQYLMLPLTLAATSFAAMPAYNQLGFAPKASKIIVIQGNEANALEVHDISGKKILELEGPYATDWEPSGEEVQVFDISKVQTPGTYLLYRNGERLGTPITVSKDVYNEVGKAALKWFYLQRASTPITAEYAGKFARPMGHPDNVVKVYGENRTISSPRGWYDAGDYGKYIVNSGITVFTLLQLYEQHSSDMDKLKFGIPNEFPKLPDLLEEIRWNLDWMLTMQNKDGSVFHKVSTLTFSGTVMPDIDTAERYAIGSKSVTATLDFAGVMAEASVVYKKFDKAYADKMLKAAENAYAWAKQNPTAFYVQPSDVNTGSYAPGDEDGKDEFRYAAAELFRATKKADYLNDLKANPFTKNGPWWGDMNFAAVIRAAFDKSFGELSKQAQAILIEEANSLKALATAQGYQVPIHAWNWNWGSNSAVANNGIILLHAYYLTKDFSYVNAAQAAFDYLLGRNPNLISYVTGFGVRSPLHPHHRPSEADYIDEPVPGMLVGGPHLGKQDINFDGKEHWKCEDYASANLPALAYIDNRCSYATNEVAINWNAPLAYLANALSAIYHKQ